MYGFSCHLCLPSGMSAPGGAALGTLGIPAVSNHTSACFAATPCGLPAALPLIDLLAHPACHLPCQGEMCRMMKEAGFGSAEVLDWDHPWNRQASACSN